MDAYDLEKPILTGMVGWIGFTTWGAFRSLFNSKINERIERRLERLESKLDAVATTVDQVASKPESHSR